MTTTLEDGTLLPPYQPPALRISATYAPAGGETTPPGRPESVEIEMYAPLPDDPHPFISSVIETLFRQAGDAGLAAVSYEQPATTGTEVRS
jgi:hypothetical protein